VRVLTPQREHPLLLKNSDWGGTGSEGYFPDKTGSHVGRSLDPAFYLFQSRPLIEQCMGFEEYWKKEIWTEKKGSKKENRERRPNSPGAADRRERYAKGERGTEAGLRV